MEDYHVMAGEGGAGDEQRGRIAQDPPELAEDEPPPVILLEKRVDDGNEYRHRDEPAWTRGSERRYTCCDPGPCSERQTAVFDRREPEGPQEDDDRKPKERAQHDPTRLARGGQWRLPPAQEDPEKRECELRHLAGRIDGGHRRGIGEREEIEPGGGRWKRGRENQSSGANRSRAHAARCCARQAAGPRARQS